MLRIGDFARLGGVTVRALRHYEAKGLLAPAQVDPATGYRSYKFDQLAALDRVLALRDLGFPLRSACALPGVRTVAGAPLAGSVTYSGSYAQTKSLRPRMIRWLERSGLRVSGPWREVYHRFGADQRGYRLPARRVATVSAQFVTELQVPAEEAR